MRKTQTNPGSTQVCVYTTFLQADPGSTRVEPTSGSELDLTRVEPGLAVFTRQKLTRVEPGLGAVYMNPGWRVRSPARVNPSSLKRL